MKRNGLNERASETSAHPHVCLVGQLSVSYFVSLFLNESSNEDSAFSLLLVS
jgi:hypothetical protein